MCILNNTEGLSLFTQRMKVLKLLTSFGSLWDALFMKISSSGTKT